MQVASAVIDRLARAVNDHDLDAIVGCFTSDYRNETPVHPARGFVGSDQVRTNWERLLGGVPDMTAEVLAVAIDDSTVWSEWEMRGTRPDGGTHLMRGVVIFGVNGDKAAWARFYLEPVDIADGGVEVAVGQILHEDARS